MSTEWRVALTIAGSDSGGGAGAQADLKTFAAHGLFGASAITAVTSQNSLGVHRVDPIPPAGLAAQLHAVFSDFHVDVVKIGMLASAAHAQVVASVLRAQIRRPIVVLDPVMVASTGHRLLADDAIGVIRSLVPFAALVTPNRAEAAVLANGPVDAWLGASSASILVTGGDDEGTVTDTWWEGGTHRRTWTAPRIGTRPFHGTGCTLASAVAARLALGDSLEDAIDGAIAWVRALVAHAEAGSIGSGNPSLAHHAVPVAGRLDAHPAHP